MATLRGLRFLILVLTGLAVCKGSTAAQASSTTSMQPSTTTSPNTSADTTQAQVSSTPTTQPSTNAISSNTPAKTTQGNQTTTVTHPSSTEVVSTMNTTSPTPTSTPTTDNSSCTFTITQEKDKKAFKVHLENVKSNPAIQYFIAYTDNSNTTDVTNTSYNEPDLQIEFKRLKPCSTYTVHVNPPCKAKTNDTFVTAPLNESDITEIHDRNDTVCFETKWKLQPGCIKKNNSESCTKKSLTIEGHKCKRELEITLPPAEIPVISFANWIPSKLIWTNKPEKCENLAITCNNTESHQFPVKSGKETREFKLFHNYSCTGVFHYKPSVHYTQKPIDMKSKTLPVEITCDPTGFAQYEKTNISIKAIWRTLKDCPTPDVKVRCLPKFPGWCNLTTWKHWTFNDLEPYTKYECFSSASYKNITKEEKELVTTDAGIPTLQERLTVTMPQHNAFQVICIHDKWNGLNGWFFAELYLGQKLEQKLSNSDCSFTFVNLYYSSNYTLKVYAVNGNQIRSEPRTKNHSTKYNDKAILGFLGFLIVLTSLALLFVLYKIYLLRRTKSRNEQEMDDLLPINALLPVDPITADALVEAYKKKIADEGRLFMEEFQSIPRIFSNYTVKEAKKAENQSKNRYVDILPYDYNRVPLSNGGRHDYINASFIEGYKEPNKYIAAQGPKEETVADFWRMIWEQNTSIIVMVTRCEEGNKNKCAQYWPSLERETEIFEDFVVKIKGQENCPDYIIRPLSLMNRKEKTPEREVTHIQFTSWPDHGVPGDPGLLLKLRRRVNSFKNVFSGPIVIHCSAGVGRTGTYICIDAMIESLESEGRVDIYGYVAKLRRQRCLMVQVEAQYVLIHTGLIEYNQFGETEISLTDFHSVVNTLRQKEGNDPSLLEMEYQKLPKFKNWRTSNTASTEENKKKNRSSTVIPYDFNRVLIKLEEEASHESDAEEDEDYSSDEEDETPTKYINASYLDGYWCPKGLIAAQGPLSDTVADFLQMLYQHRVKTVVMLSDCTENGQEFCSQYWNDEKKEFGEMVVEVKETETFPTYIRRSLEIQHTKRKESHKTEQYHFLKWAGNDLPANPLDLIDMMKSIRQRGGYKNSQENRGMPVVVHCNDGSSRSGIFCALWNILDSIDTEKLVDIFQVAKNLRKERQGMITNFEQYKFLYAALEVGFPVQNGEVKKNAASPDTVQVINEETALISAPGENQQVAESSKQAEEQTAAEASEPSEPSEASKASEQTEKAPSESTTNGPTVTVEV